MYSYFYFPALFAKEPLSVGNAQYLGHQELTTAGEILLLGIIGPFSEEFLFRFLLIVYLPYLALHHTFIKKPLETKKNVNKSISKPFIFLVNAVNKVYYRVFEMKDKKLISGWVILVSFFFAFVHGPDLYSFPLYFLPGILFSFVYLKYGFLASWICHGTANTLSGIVNAIFISFLNGS
ncbi:CPBP family intramembrane metalloprotease [Neobacillus sp. MER 74]|uniref:CPBP family intramembrane glutamic endopeptidase n=1 Tax=Neobacillus sp. MER 74 TaxID=2939566 RepID=UPI00204137A7|nr:CPBP family intramembrane glutamic endopeptidase [Neobacillus sp. MER 74]MCM3117396.1 CPBP family intramembrane metalloprotease [Neobacillus sp. MER 74]